MLFIFFNGGSMPKDAWYIHPFENLQTNFVDKIKKFGDVYLYNPVYNNFHKYNTKPFGNTNKYKYGKNIYFKLDDLNLENHSKSIYEKVKNNKPPYILVAHSRGVMDALTFAKMYPNKVAGIFIIDGAELSDEFMNWYFNKWKGQFDDMDNIKLKQLLDIIKEKYDKGEDNSEEVKFLNNFVKYKYFEQYKDIPLNFNVPVTMFVNFEDADKAEHERKKKWYQELKKLNGDNLKVIEFHNKTHFLYFTETDRIVNEISKFVKKIQSGGKINNKYSIYQNKYSTYQDKYCQYKDLYLSLKGGKNHRLTIDHVMFPIYNNPDFLKVVEDYWKTFKGKVFKQPNSVFISQNHFYVEHISVDKNLSPEDHFWSNAICLELEKKYWNYFENPLIINDNFLTPYAGAGYFFVNPHYEYTNKKLKNNDSNSFKILISNNLKKELENIANKKWILPDFVNVHPNLLHNYDIVVLDDNNKLIGPYLQSNFPLVNKLNKHMYISIN